MTILTTPPATSTPPVEQSTTPPSGDSTYVAPEWLKGVDADLLQEPAVKNMKDMNSLVKSYVNAQKMVGSDKVVVPKKGASADQWNEYYKKIGQAESADNFELVKGDKSSINDDFYGEFKKAAHANGLLPHQAQALFESLDAHVTGSLGSKAEANKAHVEAGITALKTEWGEAFQSNVDSALVAVEKFGNPELKAYLTETGLGDDPMLIKFLSAIGSSLKEQGPKGIVNTPQQTKDTLNDILADYNHPYYKADHIGHAEAVATVSALMQKVHK